MSFYDLTMSDKIKTLLKYPYNKNLYYHATPENNYRAILTHGLIGEEIWVTKGRPHTEYTSGILVELDLSNIKVKRDIRWKKFHNVFIVDENISANRVVYIFERIHEVDMRLDELQEMFHNTDVDTVKEFLHRYDIT